MNKPFYYLTLFTLERHTAWRTHLTQEEGGFDKEVNAGHIKPVEINRYKIDRKDGRIIKL